MILADWIAVALIAFFCLLGILCGFGKGLAFFTKGIFGVIIAIFVCYTFGGFIYNLGFVQSMLQGIVDGIGNAGGGFSQFLISIHIELVIYYVALFIIVLILRLIIVLIIRNVAEMNNVFMKVINKTLGMVFFVAVLVVLTLIVFQIIAAIGGDTSANFFAKLQGSTLKLDWIYENNPLLKIFNITIVKKVEIPVEVPAALLLR